MWEGGLKRRKKEASKQDELKGGRRELMMVRCFEECVCVCAEILDFGYPQNSETGALKTFITQQGIKGQVNSSHPTTHSLLIDPCVRIH